MRMRHAAFGLAALIGLTASAALAHHGWSSYSDDPFTLTGTVEMVELGSPHGHLAVRATEGVWDVTLGPPFRNRRAGIEEDAIKVGDTVTALGNRHSDPKVLEMKTERLTAHGRDFDIYPERL